MEKEGDLIHLQMSQLTDRDPVLPISRWSTGGNSVVYRSIPTVPDLLLSIFRISLDYYIYISVY